MVEEKDLEARMIEAKDKLRIAKEEILDLARSSQAEKFDFYLARINDAFQGALVNRRKYILERLEPVVKLVLFDPQMARDIREKKGYSRQKLADILRFSKVNDHQCIATYERGVVTPTLLSRGKGKVYLEWLKGEGYNPYDI